MVGSTSLIMRDTPIEKAKILAYSDLSSRWEDQTVNDRHYTSELSGVLECLKGSGLYSVEEVM